MQLSRACFLLSEFTTYHGLTLVSVRANMRSFACEIDPMTAGFYVHGAKLPAFDRIAHAVLEPFLLLLVIH
jgi:hypothetical protein